MSLAAQSLTEGVSKYGLLVWLLGGTAEAFQVSYLLVPTQVYKSRGLSLDIYIYIFFVYMYVYGGAEVNLGYCSSSTAVLASFMPT